jgi:hypothetical protein
MFSDRFRTIFIEFNEPVYAGDGGYVSSVALDQESPLCLGRLRVVSHWQEKGLWFLILLNGFCVAVPNSNVRYVYGQMMPLASPGIQTTADAVAEDTPKKRGRPPKDKE